ncbi:HlyD family type I secretion periplasmic adaptor subunit [Paracoccaceae bacterium Fryx2]|nr:HlyD family type I secretion periplasmic adaptor subunit [Paracoccaceae bacterium Fryx2]
MTTHALARARPTAPGLVDRMPSQQLRLAPPVRVGGTMVWLTILGLGLVAVMVFWTTMAAMQSAVVASGQFRVVGDRLVVQHLEGGILRRIEAREGDVVQQGDVLIELDDTRAQASLGILQNQLMAALATRARLQAEFDERGRIVPSEELQAMIAAHPASGDVLRSQLDVFQANLRLSQGLVQILEDRISQLRQQLSGTEHRLRAQANQLALLQDELAGKKTLFEQGLITKSQFLELRRDEAALTGDILVTQTQMQTVYQQIAEIEARQLQVRRDRLKEITQDRQAVNETIDDLRQRIQAASDIAERLTIRAPQSGRVVGLRVNTVGGVIEGGQDLMEIVPRDAGHVIEVQVRPQDINQVVQGGAARVRLSAYNFRTTPTVDGEVTHVSADSFTDPKSGRPYFKVDVRILPGQLEALDHVEAVPGMPAQVMIATGEQTMADYLLGPILGGFEVALSESE